MKFIHASPLYGKFLAWQTGSMPAKYRKSSRGGLVKVLSQKPYDINRRRAYVPTGNPPGRPRKYINARRIGHHAFLTAGRVTGAATPFKKGGLKRWLY